MFRNMIIHAVTMARTYLNQDHTHITEIEEMDHVTAPRAVIEVEVNYQDASVMVTVVVRVDTLCLVRTMDRPIT